MLVPSAPIKTIMSTSLLTVSPQDKLTAVKRIFDANPIHHVPVVKFRELVGMVSKTDFNYFLHGYEQRNDDATLRHIRLNVHTVEEIMTKGLIILRPTDRIEKAMAVFLENLFHAIPVVEDNELVGIITPFDVIKSVNAEQENSMEVDSGY